MPRGRGDITYHRDDEDLGRDHRAALVAQFEADVHGYVHAMLTLLILRCTDCGSTREEGRENREPHAELVSEIHNAQWGQQQSKREYNVQNKDQKIDWYLYLHTNPYPHFVSVLRIPRINGRRDGRGR